ncbi:MAG TPA: ATP-binding protein [Methanoregulaceae archaeon]|nr:ATP-binding protein [Methanoregulaceae archaeon]
MIKIVVISGKGGTGKTVFTAALSALIRQSIGIADCDVEAANLSLLVAHENAGSRPFSGIEKARIIREKCVGCGLCGIHCRFDAIKCQDGEFEVDPIHCEGCGVCMEICPEGAIVMEPLRDGTLYLSKTPRGLMAHAELCPGSGTSGLLVDQVKNEITREMSGEEVLLADGPPGIGCPTISAVSGMDAAVIVTEPSVSGLHDLKRLVNMARGFNIRLYLVINRYDLEPGMSEKIEEYARAESIPLLGRIPFDPAVIDTVREGVPVTMYDSPASRAIRKIWEKLAKELKLK